MSILKEIEHEKISKFTELNFQISHYLTVKEMTDIVK
jgi:hypothetical protein